MWGRTLSPLTLSAGGELVAHGQLARSLSEQVAAEQSRGSAVQIGVSFLAKSGEYCRTLLAHPLLRQWEADALAETAVVEADEPRVIYRDKLARNA